MRLVTFSASVLSSAAVQVLNVFVDTVIMLDLQSPGCLMGTYGIHALLFHCDFYTLLTNPGYYDGALLGREQNVAIY